MSRSGLKRTSDTFSVQLISFRYNKAMKKPIVTIFAGVNGSGKTTFYYDALESGLNFGYRVNIDEIVSAFGDWREQKDQVRASKIAIKLRNSYIKERVDFNIETTLSGSSIINLIHNLKQNGYIINLYYIALKSPELAKERVDIRVAKGGHNIDYKLIKRRFVTSLENLLKLVSICDEVILYDNSLQEFEFVFKKSATQKANLKEIISGILELC